MTSMANNVLRMELTEPLKTICDELAQQLENVCGQKIRRGKTVFIAGHFEFMIRKGHVRMVLSVAETHKKDFKLTDEPPDQDRGDS